MMFLHAAYLSVLLLSCSLIPATHALTSDEINQIEAVGKITISNNGDNHVLSSDGVPNHDYGPFPSVDNPNTVRSQSHEFTIKQSPSETTDKGCLPMGTIGLAINGVPLYNPYTLEGNNAVEGEYAEVFDDCDGHPDPQGNYHYHKIPGCLLNGDGDQLVGIALDGFPIYGPKFADGSDVTSGDLDQCHGREVNGEYRYYLSADFPYVLGCYHGEVVDTNTLNRRGQCRYAIADDYYDDDDNDDSSGSVNTASYMFSVLGMLMALLIINP